VGSGAGRLAGAERFQGWRFRVEPAAGGVRVVMSVRGGRAGGVARASPRGRALGYGRHVSAAEAALQPVARHDPVQGIAGTRVGNRE
jgi:hypothetical protein